MAGTFSQIYFQGVFTVKGRKNLLQKRWRDEVYKYISGIIKNKGHKPIIVNGVGDHIHIFIGLKPLTAISELMRDIGSWESFLGKKDMEHFLTVILRLNWFIIILRIRKSIIVNEHLKKNILNSLINLKYHTKGNTCLNG